MDETRALASFVCNLRYDNLPPDVRAHSKRFILDNIGCQIAGATLPWSKTYYDLLTETRSGDGATIVHYGTRLAADDAAFLNSTFNHANEIDDTHLKSPTHPGAVAVPAALAIMEYAKGTGKDLVTAVAAAYEIQIRISWAVSPYLIEHGHHPPVGVGPFGAAAAGAIALHLDADATLNALAIAGSHSGGLIEYTKTGGSVKRIHCAIPAQAGVRASLFAQRGITGPATILEGDKGFCKSFGRTYDLSRITDRLGERYQMLENALKPHACCHLMHTAFDAFDIVQKDARLKPDEIKSIIVTSSSEPILKHIGSIIEPVDILGAQFSLPYSLALRLYRGGNGFWDYRDEDLHDEKLLAVAHRVKVVAPPGDAWLNGMGLDFETTDGRKLHAFVEYPKGSPENPMSEQEVNDKFRSMVTPVIGTARAEAIIDAVAQIEDIKRIDEFVDLLVTPKDMLCTDRDGSNGKSADHQHR